MRAPVARSPLPALIALASSFSVLGLSTFAAVGLVEPMARDLAVSPGAVGLVITAFAVTYCVMAPALQMLFGGHDRRAMVMTGLAFVAAGAFVSAATSSYAVLLAARLATGAGAALIGPMAVTAGVALVPPERAPHALGIVMSGMTFATVLGLPLASWLGALWGWREVFVGIGVLALLNIALLGLVLPGGSRGSRATPGVLWGLLKDPVFRPAVAVTFCELSGHYTTYALISLYLVLVHGVDAALIPACLLICGLGGLCGNLVSSQLATRIGVPRMMGLALFARFAMFVAIIALPLSGALLFMVLFCWSAAGLAFMAPQQARLLALAGGQGNMAMALNSAAIYAGIAGGAAFSGLVFAWAGAPYLPYASLGLVSLGICAFRLSRRREMLRALAAQAS